MWVKVGSSKSVPAADSTSGLAVSTSGLAVSTSGLAGSNGLGRAVGSKSVVAEVGRNGTDGSANSRLND